MQARTKEVLERFIDKAKLLGQASHLETAKSASLRFVKKATGWLPEFQFQGPDREQLDAFVMRLRFFVQNNEPTSLENVSKLLQNDPTLPPDLVREFETVRSALNRIFATHPPIRVSSKGDPVPPTWGEIWEVFVYGEVAHSNAAKRERYRRWTESEPTIALLSFDLSRVFSVMASGIVFVAGLFEEEIAKGTGS